MSCARQIVAAATVADIDAARELFREYQRWLGVDLCFQGFEEELATLPGRYAPPGGALLLAKAGDDVAGCVAVRSLGGGRCEMKRLYVRPAYRARGLGRSLALAVLAEARRLGHSSMVLDTLDWMSEALALYRSLGFAETAPYTHNPLPGPVFLERTLSDDDLTGASGPD
jgi:putative acetyltransferase